MAITITASQLWDKIKQVARKNPDRSVPYCKYVYAGEPLCVVGVAVAEIVQDNDLIDRYFHGRVKKNDRWGGPRLESRNEMDIRTLFERNSKLIQFENDDEGLVDALAYIQERQDTEASWGDALQEVLEELEIDA